MLFCTRCELDVADVDVIKVPQGTHLRANCPVCGFYIKFLKQNKRDKILRDEKMPFGKYTGKSISDITKDDPSYANWAAETLDGKYGKLFKDSYYKYMNTSKSVKRKVTYNEQEDMLIVQI